MTQPITFDDEWASPGDWAQVYRAVGLQVIPASMPKRGGNWKHPLFDWEEFQNALMPEAQFDRWYDLKTGKYRAHRNMGFITGLASGGVFSVDLDIHKPDTIARQWWADLLAEHTHGQEPDTPAQRTGGGGRQILFRAPVGWSPPTFRTSAGIDIRGQGGFMMAPPSMHESGTAYDWEKGREPWAVSVADAQDWLIEAIEAVREAHGGGPTGQRRERAASDGAEHDAFGQRVDGREEEMSRSVWGAMLDIRRGYPAEVDAPFPADLEAERDRVWGQYLLRTKSRLSPRAGLDNAALLDLEGRGYTEFLRKWSRTLKQWNGKLLAESVKVKPGETKPRFTEQEDGSFVDNETGEVHEKEEPAQAEASDPPKAHADDFPAHLTQVPGLVGDIVDWMEATARYPQRALALCAALTVVGTVAGRKYATPTKSGTHLYTLALAPTGAGKNHAPKLAKRLLKKAGLDALNGPSQYMSMSAVFGELTRKPRHVAFIDEFGGYMNRIASAKGSPHERAVKDILRTAWGCSFEDLRPLSYADGRVIEPIVSPSLSICGMSTAEEFYKALTGDDVFNGFLNRFLVLRVVTKPNEVEPKSDEFEVPGDLLWAVAKVKDRVSGQIGAAFTEEGQPMLRLDWATPAARAVYTEMRKAIEQRVEDEALLSRVAEMACRLATVRAIGQDLENHRPTVSQADIEWGRDVVLWSAERMISDAQNFIAETDHQARAMLVLRIIKGAGKAAITRSALVRKLQQKFNAKTLNEALEGLVEAEHVAVKETQPTSAGGRKGTSYVAL